MFGLSKLWGYVVAAGAAVLAILGALFAAKRSGEKEVQQKVENEALKQEVNNAKVSQKVEQETAAAKPSDVDKQLRDDWTRD